MSCVVAYFFTYLNGARYVKMLNLISSTMAHLPCSENYKSFNYVYKKIRFICYYWFIILCIHLIINSTRADGLWKIIIVTFSFVLPECIQLLVLYFVWVLVLLVSMILENLKVNVAQSGKNLKKYQSLERPSFYEMEAAYSKAFQVTTDITTSFQASLLLTLLQSFHSTVSEAHIIYHGVVVEYILTLHEIINCSVWIVWQLLKVYILAHAGGYLQMQVKSLQQSLHDVPTDVLDIRMMLEVQHFSSRINSQSISITIFGFFSMESSLFFRVLGSVIMYVIILVQLDHTKQE